MIRKLYNPTASEDNLIELHASQIGCCGSELPICQYTSANFTTLSVTALTLKINEVNTAFTFSETANTVAKLKTQLIAALKAAGYALTAKEDVVINFNSPNYSIDLLGEAVAVSITNSGSPVAFTAKCTKVVVCEHITTIDALTTIELEGVETEVDPALEYPTDLPAAVAAEFATAFTGEAAIKGVTVTDDVVAEGWKIVIKAIKGTKIKVNGAYLYPVNCLPVYQA